MLKKLLISTAAAATMAGSALAADLPHYKAPPPPPPLPVLTWTGFYIGINGGYIDRQGTHVTGNPIFGNAGLVGGTTFGAVAPTAATFDLRRTHGGLAGGQIGYNWQANQYVVLGVEADADGVFGNSCGGIFGNNNNGGGAFGGNGNNCGGGIALTPVPGFPANPLLSINSGSDRMSFLATLRGRFGVLPLPNVMVYATGGLAVGNVNTTVSVIQQVQGPSAVPALYGTTLSGCGNNNGGGVFGGNNNNGNCFRVGGTAGFGVEWMFLPNWSLKAEALYYELQTIRTAGTFSNFNTAGTLFTSSGLNTVVRPRGVIARAGINYHFSWGAPAPVVARY
jgi:outer membrane immunogenic protein